MQLTHSGYSRPRYMVRRRVIISRKDLRNRIKAKRALLLIRRLSRRYASLGINRYLTRNFSARQLERMPLEMIREQVAFLRLLKQAMQNLGLFAMPNFGGLRLSAIQLKIISMIRARKTAIFMFMLYTQQRSRDIVNLQAIRTQEAFNKLPQRQYSYNHSINLYNELANRYRNDIHQTKTHIKKNWQTYWQDTINSERRYTAQTAHKMNDKWSSYVRSRG